MSTIADRLRIEPRPFEDPDAQALIERIQQLYVDLYSGTDQDATDPAEFAPPHGTFLVAYLDGTAVGCGGRRLHVPGTVEIKRMYVLESARGAGVARTILGELERTAAAAGASRITLNTGYRQRDAIEFYRAAGYRHTDDRFGHYAAIEGAYFFEKTLPDQT
jgi:GNAT superfamily N-acetyltransferase